MIRMQKSSKQQIQQRIRMLVQKCRLKNYTFPRRIEKKQQILGFLPQERQLSIKLPQEEWGNFTNLTILILMRSWPSKKKCVLLNVCSLLISTLWLFMNDLIAYMVSNLFSLWIRSFFFQGKKHRSQRVRCNGSWHGLSNAAKCSEAKQKLSLKKQADLGSVKKGRKTKSECLQIEVQLL